MVEIPNSVENKNITADITRWRNLIYEKLLVNMTLKFYLKSKKFLLIGDWYKIEKIFYFISNTKNRIKNLMHR